MCSIKVIDSIMGSGKTTWAIRYMLSQPEKRFIYVTPYISEVERIVEQCKEIEMKQPIDLPTKKADFQRLLSEGANIVTTHKLFQELQLGKSAFDHIRSNSYTLILDEVLSAVEEVEMSEYDREEIIERRLDFDDETGLARWIEEEYKGNHSQLKRIVDTRSVYLYQHRTLLWQLPERLFKPFDDVFLLTFLYPGSAMAQYLKICSIACETYHIADGELIPGAADLSAEKQRIASLIHIYKGPLNATGERTALKERGKQLPVPYSVSWWKSSSANIQAEQRIATQNAYNLFNNIWRASADKTMWTKIKPDKKGGKEETPKLCGHYASSFCPCNARATNAYRDRIYLAYLVDVYPDPTIATWFRKHGAPLDREQYALSQLIQWIWRSAIRDRNPIWLYIPSKRMRDMLTKWLGSPAA